MLHWFLLKQPKRPFIFVYSYCSLALQCNVPTNRREQLGDKSVRYLRTLYNLGVLLNDLGQYEEAESIYKENLLKVEQVFGKVHSEYIHTLMNLASLYEETGREEEASLQIKEALPLTAELVGEQHPFYARLLSNLASLYARFGELNLAEEQYLKAIAILEKMGPAVSQDYLSTMDKWAAFLERRERYAQALVIREQLLAYFLENGGAKQPRALRARTDIADTYQLRGDYARAEQLYRAILRDMGQIMAEKDFFYLSNLEFLISALIEQNKQQAAWKNINTLSQLSVGLDFDQSVSADWVAQVEKAAPQEARRLQKLINTYTLAYRLLGMKKEVPIAARYRLSKLLLRLYDNWRERCTTKEDKLRTLSNSSRWIGNSLASLPEGAEEEAFALADRHKAVLVLEALQSETGYAFGRIPDSLQYREQQLLKQRNETTALLQESQEGEERQVLLGEINQVNRDLEALRRLLEEKYPRYAAFKEMDDEVKLKELQAQLPEATALIEYVLTDEKLYYFYIDAQQLKLFERDIPADSLRQQIRQMRKLISGTSYLELNPENSFTDFSKLSHRLYQELLAPALAEAQGIAHLLIIPDGELAHLPFEVFLVEPPAEAMPDYRKLHYLLEDYSISYNYSAELWLENCRQKANARNSELLAMAAHYDGQEIEKLQARRLPAYRSLRKHLEPLPEARQEVLMLSERFNGRFLTDTLATERFFKEQAGQYGIIHLAMHGLLNVQRPLLSSLAFTEGGDSLENNFLQAYEISRLNLGASLVVLSACETGFGTYENGNGTASLARSFMYAGVPALVVSLWQVNDASTSKLMKFFYEGLAEGQAKDEALCQAKLRLIREARNPLEAHPALWAPFIQMGDSRPIELSERGAWLAYWPWALGGLVVLLGVWLLWKGRGE